MSSDQIPEDGITHPLFISPIPYLYQVSYQTSRKTNQVITYTSPHEIILNLYCFKNGDRLTYLDRDTKDQIFTITIDRFKYLIAESIYQVDQEKLELLYMRLLLTNRYSIIFPLRHSLIHEYPANEVIVQIDEMLNYFDSAWLLLMVTDRMFWIDTGLKNPFQLDAYGYKM